MSVAIKLTLPNVLAKQAQEHVTKFGYTNIQELTLEALRELNKKLEITEFHKKHYKTATGDHLSDADKVEAFDELLKLKKL